MTALGHAIESLKNHGDLFEAERCSLSVLENITQMLGRDLGIKMEPGLSWGMKPGVLTYDRASLLKLPPVAAPGLIFHNIGHARYSKTEVNLREAATKLASMANRKTGPRSIHPSSILQMFDAVEDERMEARLRRKYRGLQGTYLPRHDKGWRKDHFLKRYHELAQVSATGKVDEAGVSVYWKRAAFAVRSLVSGAINHTHLPPDMPWSEEICNKIASIRDAKTINEGLREFSKLIPDLVKARDEYNPPPPQEQPQDSDGPEGQPGPCNSGGGTGGDSKPSDPDDDGRMDGDPDNDNDSGNSEEGEISGDNSESPGKDGDAGDGGSGGGASNTDTEPAGSEPERDGDDSDSNDGADSDDDSEDESEEDYSGDDSDEESDESDDDDGSLDDGSDSGESGDGDAGEEDDEEHESDTGGDGTGDNPSDEDPDLDKEFEEGEGDDEEEDEELEEPGEEEGEGDTEEDVLKSILDEANQNGPEESEGDKSDEFKNATKDTDDVTFLDSMPDGIGDTDGDLAGNASLNTASLTGPSWEKIRQVVSDHASQIRRQMDRYFKDNELSDKETGYKSGRFDARQWVRSHFTGGNRYYSRRTQAGEKSFGVFILVDISGSMSAGERTITPYPDAFMGIGRHAENAIEQVQALKKSLAYVKRKGNFAAIKSYQRQIDDYERSYQQSGAEFSHEYEHVTEKGYRQRRERTKTVIKNSTASHGYRWQFAIRMTIAIAEALSRFKEIKFAVAAFDSPEWDYDTRAQSKKGGFHPLKEFNNTLNPVVKQVILDRLAATQGGTVILRPLDEIRSRFKKLSADKKLLIILTDGQFGDNHDEIMERVKALRNEGVEMVVMTLGCDATFAEQFVPKTHAVRVNEDNVGKTMGEALKRMVKGK